MRRIFKYEFEIQDNIKIEMPVDAKILTVDMQGLKPCVWALVEDSAPKEIRFFKLFHTNDHAPVSSAAYIGTFQMHWGALVFHLFYGY